MEVVVRIRMELYVDNSMNAFNVTPDFMLLSTLSLWSHRTNIE